VHILFGCSLPALNSDEGCGEERLCLSCVGTKDENNAIESWRKKSTVQKFKFTRSASSYLVSQPGFEHFNLNQKGSSMSICFLKNGNMFNNRPIKLSGSEEKYILSNTCAIDSLMTILACSASDSYLFKTYLCSVENKNLAIKFILNMLKENGKKIYNKRLEILFPKFKTKCLVGGLKLMDVTDTATGMAKKILNDMTSVTWASKCFNQHCEKNQCIKSVASNVISLCIHDDQTDFEKEIEKAIQMEEICDKCMTMKDTSIILGECLIIEINVMPKGKILL